MRKITFWLAVSYLTMGGSIATAQQSFTCNWGKEAACLDYGAKVCSQFGKCVDENAVCFKKSTCDYNGFMCTSDHEEYAKKAKAMAANYDDFRSCVTRASDMDDVATCVQRDSYR
ncbi:hypothetical protein [Shinella sp.]|uniref:hypothetical protein n=1 Tax=Shinella sp. TaxID=1870904 RepID=UPI0039E6F383